MRGWWLRRLSSYVCSIGICLVDLSYWRPQRSRTSATTSLFSVRSKVAR